MPRRNSNPIQSTQVLQTCVEENGDQYPVLTQRKTSGKMSPSSYDSGMLPGTNSTPLGGSTLTFSQKCRDNENSNEQSNSEDSNSFDWINNDLVGKDPTGRIRDFLNSSNHQDCPPQVKRTTQGRVRRHSQNCHSNSVLMLDRLDGLGGDSHAGGNLPLGRRQNKTSFSNERKSRSGKSINICKNGAGGKFTWGKPGIEYSHGCPSGVNDIHDPNYDEFGEDENTVYDIKTSCDMISDSDLKLMLEGPFREYLVNSDDSELISIFDQIQYNSYAVARVYFHLLIWGLESSKKFRGHLWKLIEKCTCDTPNNENSVLAKSDFRVSNSSCLFKALEDFFDARVELIIDNPDYDEFIQKILGCLISKLGNADKKREGKIDKFLKEECDLRAKTFSKVINVSYSIALRIKKDQTKSSNSSTNCSDNIMSTIWITNDFLTPEQLSYELQKIVDDWKYDGYSSKSLIEDIQKGLNTPHYYHELIYKLISKAMYVGTPESVNACIDTIEDCIKKDVIEQHQVKQGFFKNLFRL